MARPTDPVHSIRAAVRAFAIPLLVGLAGLVAGPAPGQADAPKMLNLRIGPHPDKTRVVMDLDRPVKASHFVLADPYRVVLVLPEMDFRALKPARRPRHGIAGYRYGLFRPKESRVVIDLQEPFRVKALFSLPADGPRHHRLVLDLEPATRAAFVAAATTSVRERAAQRRAPPREAAPPLPVPRNVKRRRVVIDPGHGGVDPGAVGISGVYEKIVVLAASRVIKAVLEQSGRYQVILTRDRDVFLPLRRRVAIARDAGADLFLSIHADSIGKKHLRGASVYTLSERASDEEAQRLAEMENRSDVLAGVDYDRNESVVTDILIDLKQRQTMNQSAVLAEDLAASLRRSVRTHKNAHRFAGFAVLKAPDVPSALLEIGYLSNPVEERMIRTPEFQMTLARAVLRGIDEYFVKNPPAAR